MSALAGNEGGAVGPPVAETPAAAAPGEARARRKGVGLAGRLLALTIAGAMAAIAMFYVTRLSLSRENWLHDRLVAAQTAAIVFGANQPPPLPPELTKKILDTVEAKMIVLSMPGRQVTLAVAEAPLAADYTFDITDPSFFEGVRAAIQTLFAPRGSTLKIEGPAQTRASRVEILIDQTPLIDQMWRVSRNFLTLALIVSAAVMLVLWAALWQLVIRPVKRLTSSIIAFGEKPQDLTHIVAPTGRDDEIGRAETALAAMQDSLAQELSQRKRLAELGMAVARINHDLRNMLAAAQLISDRLSTITDPLAQRLAPQLVATLDRAIDFCQSTLAYGAARERAPERRPFDLREVVRLVVEAAEATKCGAILYSIDIPPNFELFADPDHVRRVIENLNRNAAQALLSRAERGNRPLAIRFAAIRTSSDKALIEISDSGPGFKPEDRAHIFEPFHLSTRHGGSGLGLAIACDLIERNGGSITLADSLPDDFYCGARFLINLPTPPETDKVARAALAS